MSSKTPVQLRGAFGALLKEHHATGTLSDVVSQPQLPSPSNKLINDLNSSQQSQNHREPKQIRSTDETYFTSVDPKKCRPWKFADRSEAEMGDLEELANRIKIAGQQEPVLLRPLKEVTDDGVTYEVIFGNRRWRAASMLNIPLKALVRDISDQDAAIAQKEENENREDLSDYTKAKSFKAMIDAGLFDSQAHLGVTMNIPKATLSELMTFIKLPNELVSNIKDIHKLSKRTCARIIALINKDKSNLEAIIKLAPDISNGTITSNNLEKRVKTLREGKKQREYSHKVVIGKGGAEIFTIRSDSNGAPCVVLHKAARSVVDIEHFEQYVKSYIDTCIEESADK